jgi:hypothetical protein
MLVVLAGPYSFHKQPLHNIGYWQCPPRSCQFHYTRLPNAVISATSHSKAVTQALLNEFPMVFNHSFHSVLLYDTKYTSRSLTYSHII